MALVEHFPPAMPIIPRLQLGALQPAPATDLGLYTTTPRSARYGTIPTAAPIYTNLSSARNLTPRTTTSTVMAQNYGLTMSPRIFNQPFLSTMSQATYFPQPSPRQLYPSSTPQSYPLSWGTTTPTLMSAMATTPRASHTSIPAPIVSFKTPPPVPSNVSTPRDSAALTMSARSQQSLPADLQSKLHLPTTPRSSKPKLTSHTISSTRMPQNTIGTYDLAMAAFARADKERKEQREKEVQPDVGKVWPYGRAPAKQKKSSVSSRQSSITSKGSWRDTPQLSTIPSSRQSSFGKRPTSVVAFTPQLRTQPPVSAAHNVVTTHSPRAPFLAIPRPQRQFVGGIRTMYGDLSPLPGTISTPRDGNITHDTAQPHGYSHDTRGTMEPEQNVMYDEEPYMEEVHHDRQQDDHHYHEAHETNHSPPTWPTSVAHESEEAQAPPSPRQPINTDIHPQAYSFPDAEQPDDQHSEYSQHEDLNHRQTSEVQERFGTQVSFHEREDFAPPAYIDVAPHEHEQYYEPQVQDESDMQTPEQDEAEHWDPSAQEYDQEPPMHDDVQDHPEVDHNGHHNSTNQYLSEEPMYEYHNQDPDDEEEAEMEGGYEPQAAAPAYDYSADQQQEPSTDDLFMLDDDA